MNLGSDPRLSVIIPAYNEQERIGVTLKRLREYFAGVDYEAEIIVVDDGSVDRTVEIVREFNNEPLPVQLLVNQNNMGKGFSVRRGMMLAKGRYRLFFDADASTPIEEIAKFWPHFEKGTPVCIGSRAMSASNIEVHQPWYRETMGRIFNILVQVLVMRGIKDTQCGFKAFSAAATETIFTRQRLIRFGFDVELLSIARLHGLPVAEVPIKWINSPESRVHPIRDAYSMFRDLFMIRLNILRRVYR